ncbi:MAG: DUF192 domain-containing protein [Myxococcota bacterium]|jgi:hypothetical protein|nr:DUF192 domain-containing protein [Myxococcota bacterium]
MINARSRHALAASLLLALWATACEAEPEPPAGPTIKIRDQVVALEITSTRAEQSRGLGGRDELPWHHGMLFEYPSPRFPGFWMKDMRFDIDIVWIREGRIVDISHRVPHFDDGPGPTIRPRELTDTVLEVPAGYAQAHGWRIGDRATLDRGTPDDGEKAKPRS